jgi:hypothetical protein
MIVPLERLKFPKDIHVLKLLAIIIISYLSLYGLMTYHWKSFKKNYNSESCIQHWKNNHVPGENELPPNHVGASGCFFNFVMLLKWRSSKSIFSQIWWYSKYESKNI